MRIETKITTSNSNSLAFPCISLILLFLTSFTQVYAQTEIEQIMMVRNASNDALKSLDNELSYTFLTDDIMITTGNGTLINGKDEYRKYDNKFDGNSMYWIRTADEIEVNIERGLAWESGIWKGYDLKKGRDSVVNGKYSAMWSKSTGHWLIKSQLFVTLE